MSSPNFVIIYDERSKFFGGFFLDAAIAHARDLRRAGHRINRIERAGVVVLEGDALDQALRARAGS